MVHYLSVDEIVPADYVNWFKQSDYLANWKTIAPSNVTCTEIEADGGKQNIIMKLMPGIPFVSDRSITNTIYRTQVGED